jgi:hypothetical protein
VAAPLDGEECHHIVLSSCLREALSHRKGHKFVLRPMSDENRARYLAHLAQVIETLLYEQAHN